MKQKYSIERRIYTDSNKIQCIKNLRLLTGWGLKEAKDFFEKSFNCKVEIVSGDKTDNPKGNVAEPGKPGILIE